MRTSRGFRQPLLSGMSSATSVRKTYSTAAITTELGALKLPGCCGEVPVKSRTALRAARSTRRADLDDGAAVGLVAVRAVARDAATIRRTDSSALSCTCRM